MPAHEQKICPKCTQLFECKVGSLELCQCTVISLNPEEREYIQNLYDDCLCIYCLHDLRTEYHQLNHQKKLEKISSLFASEKSNKNQNL